MNRVCWRSVHHSWTLLIIKNREFQRKFTHIDIHTHTRTQNSLLYSFKNCQWNKWGKELIIGNYYNNFLRWPRNEFAPQDFLSVAIWLGRIKSMNVTKWKHALEFVSRLYISSQKHGLLIGLMFCLNIEVCVTKTLSQYFI
jgi:hypothetical protein